MAPRQVKALQEKSGKYGGSKSFILGKQQLAYSAKDLQDSTAQTMAMHAFWHNVGYFLIVYPKLLSFVSSHLISFPNLFLRTAILERKYGQIFSTDFPKFPNPTEAITDKAGYPIRMIDDVTAINKLTRTSHVDLTIFQHAETAVDKNVYDDVINAYSEVIARSVATDYNNMALAYAMAGGPMVTLSQNALFVPLIDSSRRPDQNKDPAAYEYYDPNGSLAKFIKTDIFGQVEQKFKNIRRYSVEYWAMYKDKIEITKPTQVTQDENATEFSKAYFKKENNKQYLLPGINRFISVFALYQAIRATVHEMATQWTPTNMAGFDPYSTSEKTDLQDSGGHIPYDQIEVIMNPRDYWFGQTNAGKPIISTSPEGNLLASLADIEELGVKIYLMDAILEGQYKAQQKGTFNFIEYVDESFTNTYDFYAAKKYGRHVFCKVAIKGIGCYVHGVPAGGYVPSSETALMYYRDLEQA